MLRNNLLDNNYNFEPKEPKHSIIGLIWMLLFIFIMASFIIILIINIKPIDADPNPAEEVEAVKKIISNAVLVAMLILYFFLKFKITSLFCINKKQNVNMKIVEDLGLPVCACREALKTKQFVFIYTIPIVLNYLLMCLSNIFFGGGGEYIFSVFIMSLLMSFDLTLVVYLLYLQKKYKFDYLAINNHVYKLTMYTKRMP